MEQISKTAHAAIERQYRILNEEILPKLREEDICFLRRGELTPAQSAWVKNIFRSRWLLSSRRSVWTLRIHSRVW